MVCPAKPKPSEIKVDYEHEGLVVRDAERNARAISSEDASLAEKRQIKAIAASGRADRVGRDIVKIDGSSLLTT
jgi:hypothetical protein